MREFETGATRDADETKLDYEGFFSPLVLKRRAEYMNKHRVQPNGQVRDSDNWQRGMPLEVYMKSAFRHFMEWWSVHRDDAELIADAIDHKEMAEEAICALMFNCEGYLYELLKEEYEANS